MTDVVTLYEIVPTDSGIHYMCYDDETKTYYREHKAYTHQQALVFETEELAEEYIKLHMGEGYKAEYFGHSLSLAPFKIRNTADLG